MNKLLQILGEKPVIGMVSGVSSSVLSFISSATEVLQFAGIVGGLAIAILTGYKLLIELRLRKLEEIREKLEIENLKYHHKHDHHKKEKHESQDQEEN